MPSRLLDGNGRYGNLESGDLTELGIMEMLFTRSRWHGLSGSTEWPTPT